MENISKIANNVLSSKPELELTRIWGEIMCRHNIALHAENSDFVQTLVVDAYEGIKHKLGREKIDENIMLGAWDEIKEALAFGEMVQSDAVNDLKQQIFEKIESGELDLGELGNIKFKVGETEAINGNEAELTEQILTGSGDGGKVVEMPQPKTRKTAVKHTDTE